MEATSENSVAAGDFWATEMRRLAGRERLLTLASKRCLEGRKVILGGLFLVGVLMRGAKEALYLAIGGGRVGRGLLKSEFSLYEVGEKVNELLVRVSAGLMGVCGRDFLRSTCSSSRLNCLESSVSVTM